MQPSLLSLLLLLSSLPPPSLTILLSPSKPNGYQLYDSVTLSCDGDGSGSWKVKRSTQGSGVRACLSGWGSQEPGAPCVIRYIYPADIGSYWCESALGERGPAVNITIRATDSPCFASTAAAEPSASSAPPLPLIPRVTPQKEAAPGNFTTSPGFTESATDGATVKDSASSPSLSVLRILCHVVVSAPYLVSTVLLGLIYRDRWKAQKEQDKSHDVIMEVDV